jgi:hypothetical protein
MAPPLKPRNRRQTHVIQTSVDTETLDALDLIQDTFDVCRAEAIRRAIRILASCARVHATKAVQP